MLAESRGNFFVVSLFLWPILYVLPFQYIYIYVWKTELTENGRLFSLVGKQ
jgi:hypothetical protein